MCDTFFVTDDCEEAVNVVFSLEPQNSHLLERCDGRFQIRDSMELTKSTNTFMNFRVEYTLCQIKLSNYALMANDFYIIDILFPLPSFISKNHICFFTNPHGIHQQFPPTGTQRVRGSSGSDLEELATVPVP